MFAQLVEDGPAIVDECRVAVARFDAHVLAAHGAEPGAVVATEAGFVDGEQDLLADHRTEIDLTTFDRERPIQPGRIVVQVDGPPPDSRLTDFRQRRRLGNGTFIDRAEIERRNPRVLSDLLRNVPGVRLENFQGGLRYVSGRFRSLTSSAGSGNGSCDMMIYLNGQPFPSDAGTSDARIRVTEILALEVYVAAGSVPREFAGTNAACGVILIWLGT